MQRSRCWWLRAWCSVPRVAFINKLDRTGADPWKVIDAVRKKLRHNCAAVQVSPRRLSASTRACSGNHPGHPCLDHLWCGPCGGCCDVTLLGVLRGAPCSALPSLPERLLSSCATWQIPIGLEGDLEGLVDLVSMRAIYFEGPNG